MRSLLPKAQASRAGGPQRRGAGQDGACPQCTAAPRPARFPGDAVLVTGNPNYLISFSSPLEDLLVVLDV